MDADNIPIPIFLSCARPFTEKQDVFLKSVNAYLKKEDFDPNTLGVNYYGTGSPLETIREMMNKCYGLLSIAFRRANIEKGTEKPDTSLFNQVSKDISGSWITSPYCHIEPSMAFQINMPILIFREKGVIEDGILEKGTAGLYMPEFTIGSDYQNDQYFGSDQWNQLIKQWKKNVLEYMNYKQFEANEKVKHIISCSICQGKGITSKQLYKFFQMSCEKSKPDYQYFSSLIYANENFTNIYECNNDRLDFDYSILYVKYFK